jgi:hypothetical protein
MNSDVFSFIGLLLLLLVWLHVALHRVSIRTPDELFFVQARCRLRFERRVDATIYRPVLKTKVGSQSSEHGVVAEGLAPAAANGEMEQITTSIDLSKAQAGQYFLSTTHEQDQAAYYYPLQIK